MKRYIAGEARELLLAALLFAALLAVLNAATEAWIHTATAIGGML
jgi:hypothetical protein